MASPSPLPFRIRPDHASDAPPAAASSAPAAPAASSLADLGTDSPRRGAGGKLRPARRSSLARPKKSPYDRPASGRHATPGGSAASAAAASYGKSIASRFVDSASRLITSSASFVFSSLFKRPQLAIANGGVHTGVVAEGQQEKVSGEAAVNHDDNHDATSDAGRSLVGNCAGPQNRELDLGQVEGFLKQQTWSREEVNRLTEILQNRVLENNADGPKSEAQRWREQRKKAWDNSTPVEVARAYMGERTSRLSETTVSFRETPQQIDRVAEHEPVPGFGLFENRYRSSPVSKSWAQSPSAVRMPRRSSVLDNDWASGGPIRRNRQKSLALANSSPYARGMTGATAAPRTLTSPPMQSSQTARKILETLEKLTPPPKEKALKEERELATGRTPTKQTLPTLEVRERKNMQNTKTSMLPIVREPAPSNGELALKVHAPVDSGKVENPTTCSPMLTPGSPTVISEKSKGFRMSALFEESNSDDEILIDAKLLPTEERFPATLSEVKEAPMSGSSPVIKLTPVPAIVPSTASDRSISMEKFMPTPAQLSVSNAAPLASTTMTQSSGLSPVPLPPVGSSDFHASSVVAVSSAPSERPALFSSSPFPAFSPPIVMEAKTPGFSSPFQSFSFPSVATETRLPVSSASSIVKGPVGVTLSQAAVPPVDAQVPHSSALPAAAPVVARVSVPSAITASTGVSVSETTVSQVSCAPTAAVVSLASATASQAAPAGVLLSSSTVSEVAAASADAGEPLPPLTSPAAIVDLFEGENGATMATEGPGSDKLAEGDTMATDPMAEEPDTFNMSLSTTTFSFGSSSAVSSMSHMPTFSFGASGMSSPSATFAGQSAGAPTTPPPSSYTFVGQSGTSSAGQPFAFGASLSPSATGPFALSRTTNAAPSFTFGSSSSVANTSVPPAFTFGSLSAASSSAVPVFPSTSSSLPSFSGTASTPSTFSFGPHVTSSSLSNSSSAGSIFGFGVQQTAQTASPFNASGAANSSPAFTFGSVPTAVSSAAPTFSFGAGVGTSLSSGSSFAGQSFNFGGQGTAIASPFSQAGNSNSAPTFPFGSSSSAVPAFSFGSSAATTPSPTFAFGAQSATPFTFGGQTGASPAGQPFGFAPQPTAPAQAPFSPAGASNAFTQPGLEFAGGFALGASGGDKRERKYIKPKRTAGAKRGK